MSSREQGFTTVEFAVAGLAFFILLFGVIEAGRWLFAVNTLTEATRRGARYAAVCDDLARIRSVTLFGAAGSGTTTSPLLSDLQSTNVIFERLNATTAQVYGDRTDSNVNAVRVRISGYSIALNVPGFAASLPLPACATTVPIEVKQIKTGSDCPP